MSDQAFHFGLVALGVQTAVMGALLLAAQWLLPDAPAVLISLRRAAVAILAVSLVALLAAWVLGRRQDGPPSGRR